LQRGCKNRKKSVEKCRSGDEKSEGEQNIFDSARLIDLVAAEGGEWAKKRPSVETEGRLTIACHMKNLQKSMLMCR
jgi:tRNA 2-selenouridine synthase SelU